MYPTFSKAGITTLVLSKGTLYPTRRPITPQQVRQRSQGGVRRVTTIGPEEEQLGVRIEGLTLTDYNELRAWFRNPLIEWGEQPFTYTDEDGVATEVRWWQDTFDMPEVSAGAYSVDIVFAVE